MNEATANDATILSEWSAESIQAPGSGTNFLIKVHPRAEIDGLIELGGDRFVIGRDTQCDLRLEGASISRQHAAVELRGPRSVLLDLGSTNGTFVNDLRISCAALKAGDRIRVGGQVLKFLAAGDVESQYHETMYMMSFTDGLTGAHNKRYLLENLRAELVAQLRQLAILMIDIDHFKKINDKYGHLAGDAILQEWCRRVRELLREGDILARYGGEEFVIVLPDTGHEQAQRIAERLRSAAESEPVETTVADVNFTVSLGVACQSIDSPRQSAEQFIGEADQRLYQAKSNGRNQVCGASV